LQVTVNLSQPATQPVQVTLSTSDGTAQAGSDYSALNQVVTFAAGESSQTVDVALLDDNLAEGDETFTVTLSSPVNANLGTASATATIVDNELSACGAPSFSAATETGVFLWKDCATGLWHARYSPGGQSVTYRGGVVSHAVYASVTPYSIEASDTLDFTTDPARIDYVLNVSTKYTDGFDFMPATGSATCFNVTAPSGVNVYVGNARALLAAPFDLATLGACAP
jgi:hypothetical protein